MLFYYCFISVFFIRFFGQDPSTAPRRRPSTRWIPTALLQPPPSSSPLAKKGDSVLDLCCGSGDLAFLLSEKVGPNGQIAAYRQRRRSKLCCKNTKCVEGNAVELPFFESYFDAITIGYGLTNVVDGSKAMEEMCRVLKKGSKVSVLYFNKSTQPLITLIQDLMVDYVIVHVASGHGLGSEYGYLKNSIKEYLTGDELEKLALEVGFSSAKHFEVGEGIMGNLVATR
ncbi:unnamed protein product [Fraxinus pennsylvanica]|uniref:2-phytyl-1,4-beta-naphthoquinone methyltransferase, chloroplastic n=1 Tax=Fraxinus pennsylvanica TaxID=56036 RepID=A0AAD1Z225_9LAMI|nr:unnamed protein product [Fraxinus pennsylvanica]